MKEITFEVREDEIAGGYIAHALRYDIHTQGETLDKLRSMIKDAVICHFESDAERPKIIRLHIFREETFAL